MSEFYSDGEGGFYKAAVLGLTALNVVNIYLQTTNNKTVMVDRNLTVCNTVGLKGGRASERTFEAAGSDHKKQTYMIDANGKSKGVMYGTLKDGVSYRVTTSGKPDLVSDRKPVVVDLDGQMNKQHPEWCTDIAK